MKFITIKRSKALLTILSSLMLSIFMLFIVSCNLIPVFNKLGNSKLTMKFKAEGPVNDEGMKNCVQIIKNRLTSYGVPEKDITINYELDEISLGVKNIDNPERLALLVSTTGNLEFWKTWDIKDVYAQLESANKKLRGFYKNRDTVKNSIISKETFDTITIDTSSLVSKLKNRNAGTNVAFEEYERENPLFAYLKPNLQQGDDGKYYLGKGPNVGYCAISDTSKVNKMMTIATDSGLFKKDIRFLWEVKAFDEKKSLLWLIAIYVDDDGKPALNGDNVTAAYSDYDVNGNNVISMTMNSYGSNVWKKLTKKNIGKNIAIVLDNFVYSYPTVQGEIPNGRSLITGNFTKDEADDMATILKLGKLPYKLNILSSEVVEE